VEAVLTMDEARRLLSRAGFLEALPAGELDELARGADFSRLPVDGGLAVGPAEHAERMLLVLGGRLVWMEGRWADVAAKGVAARLAGMLLTLVEEEGVMTPEGSMVPARYTTGSWPP
jgi:hypothetical protein